RPRPGTRTACPELSSAAGGRLGLACPLRRSLFTRGGPGAGGRGPAGASARGPGAGPQSRPAPDTGSLASGFSDTFYSYDALDNLVEVVQGPQTRSFGYDSLSRLVSETHPESGTATYGYDANSNLISRTDARGVTTSHVYDNLDRTTFTSYSDGTPSVTYNYDTAVNGVGRPASVFDGAGDSSFSYDEVGRISVLTRTNRVPGGASKTFTAQYEYNLTGGVEEAYYPDTGPTPWTIEYDYDEQGRQTRVLGRDSTQSNTLISGYSFTYHLSSATETTFYTLNNTVEQVSYNERMQPAGRNVFLNTSPFTWMMGLAYDYAQPGTGANDGNVWAVTDQRDSTHSMSYGYDYLNRISEVDGFGWSANYSYDRYGNRSAFFSGTLPPGVQQPPAVGFSPFTNRISGKSYDAAGNLLFEDGHSLQWDAESRLESMDNGATGRYLYDYQGRRAVKLTPGQDRFYFHEASGEVLWEFVAGSPVQDLVRAFHNGRAFFENGSVGSHYLHADHLGSPRILSSTFGAVVDCRQFFTPFGQHAHECPGSDHRVDFTGKEEDGESRFTYFGARYHDPLIGRFLSPDPFAHLDRSVQSGYWRRKLYRLMLCGSSGRVDENKFFKTLARRCESAIGVGLHPNRVLAVLDKPTFHSN
ncbi:MAG TPA: RHS repeat-associated core domain-containing protein, partial [Acidobacteriota bacterium]|nr:RHS repeat-associated core domain-containing protein [Acidobacteriota bacterium]